MNQDCFARIMACSADPDALTAFSAERRRRPELPIDLRGADLRGMTFFQWQEERGGRPLIWVSLNLAGADLRGADLRWADLSEANLRGARLDGVRLQGANLKEANCSGASFCDADCSWSILLNTVFQQADLTRADCSGARMVLARLNDAILENTRISGRQLREADVVGCSGKPLLLDDSLGAGASSTVNLPLPAETPLPVCCCGTGVPGPAVLNSESYWPLRRAYARYRLGLLRNSGGTILHSLRLTLGIAVQWCCLRIFEKTVDSRSHQAMIDLLLNEEGSLPGSVEEWRKWCGSPGGRLRDPDQLFASADRLEQAVMALLDLQTRAHLS